MFLKLLMVIFPFCWLLPVFVGYFYRFREQGRHLTDEQVEYFLILQEFGIFIAVLLIFIFIN